METNKLTFYKPHPKQLAFHNASHRFRAFMGGNRTGKTYCGAAEVSMHATGIYPSWWAGKRFSQAVDCWVATDSFSSLKNAIMPLYLGGATELEFGTGTLPKERIESWRQNPHVPGSLESVRVKHISGGVSTIYFKSYEQGRDKFQGAKIGVIHLDEEPPQDIFAECAMRMAATNGCLLLTMTPLKGMSDVCLRFLEGNDQEFYFYIQASWQDNPYLSEEDIRMLRAGSEPHMLEAREKGIPSIGHGRVYPIMEEQILVEPFELPSHFRYAFGMDFGWNNTAAVFGAYDDNTDTLYLFDCYKQGERSAIEHGAFIRALGGASMPGVCDPSGDNNSIKGGDTIADEFRSQGLMLTPANNDVEAGISRVYTMMRAGKLKVFNSPKMAQWFREFRLYQRDERGAVKKKEDHLMDATRYLVMSGIQLAKAHNVKKSRWDIALERVKNPINWRTV